MHWQRWTELQWWLVAVCDGLGDGGRVQSLEGMLPVGKSFGVARASRGSWNNMEVASVRHFHDFEVTADIGA